MYCQIPWYFMTFSDHHSSSCWCSWYVTYFIQQKHKVQISFDVRQTLTCKTEGSRKISAHPPETHQSTWLSLSVDFGLVAALQGRSFACNTLKLPPPSRKSLTLNFPNADRSFSVAIEFEFEVLKVRKASIASFNDAEVKWKVTAISPRELNPLKGINGNTYAEIWRPTP